MTSSDKAIKTVAKGGFFIFVGVMISSVSFFLYRILAARYLGPSDYGLLMLGVITLKIAALVGLVGIHQSVGKYLNDYLTKKKYAQAKGVLISSMGVVIPVSLLVCTLLFVGSSFLANHVFGQSALGDILKIFAIGVPLSVFAQLCKQYFYAFHEPKRGILSESFADKALTVLLLMVAIALSLDVYAVSVLFIGATLTSALVSGLLLYPLARKLWNTSKQLKTQYKTLLTFSLPLLIVGILDLALGWADMIFLGIFYTSQEVGLYSAAYALSSSVVLVWVALGDMFYPVISSLFAKKDFKGIARVFSVTSRWIYVLIIPAVALILVFPHRVLSLLFGSSYVIAGQALFVLTLGYAVLAALGLAEQGLRTYQKTKQLGIITFSCFVLNIVLNLLLIPRHGMLGASIATMITLTVFALAKYIVFYQLTTPSLNFRLYGAYTGLAVISLVVVFGTFHTLDWFGTIGFLLAMALYTVLYFALVFFSNCFSKEDKVVLFAVGRRNKLLNILIKKVIK